MRVNSETPAAKRAELLPEPGSRDVGPAPAAGWQRAEGLAVLALGLGAYAVLDLGGWLLFALLLFAPDLSMVGYLAGPRPGAMLYNLAHTYVSPILIGVGGWIADSATAFMLATIWMAHIGLDRALGYGLKLPRGFRYTHLGRIGRG